MEALKLKGLNSKQCRTVIPLKSKSSVVSPSWDKGSRQQEMAGVVSKLAYTATVSPSLSLSQSLAIVFVCENTGSSDKLQDRTGALGKKHGVKLQLFKWQVEGCLIMRLSMLWVPNKIGYKFYNVLIFIFYHWLSDCVVSLLKKCYHGGSWIVRILCHFQK